ncbi:CHY zinc finger protein [Desertibacillus haloalkaliphilus]|uniref:CHY zinc finger protein n=1 Tax=Desertibacillus haloalkaliphilus TaxID=1328930 RepID=UPI0028AF4CAC|nr:CHY zinc finger protein [Desertibacillus haloalkaliphilus]
MCNKHVQGVGVDAKTRCKHYSSKRDIIAIKVRCCQTYYSCHRCHQELTDHTPILWGKHEHQQKAILCGNCQQELTIADYLNFESVCPYCQATFNEGCKFHYHLYFEM